MSLLSKLFGKNPEPKRIRVCVECGMPVDAHKEWCAIYRAKLARAAQAAVKAPAEG